MCFVEPQMAFLDHVWLVMLRFGNSTSIQMILWILLSYFGEKTPPAQDFHNIGITS